MKHKIERRFYSLLEDFVFKQIFGDRKNTGKLATLPESLLPLQGEEIAALKIGNTFIERAWKNEKPVILDVLAVTKSGLVFDVELQIVKLMFFLNRVVYCLYKLVTDRATALARRTAPCEENLGQGRL
ncbi:MAG: Rpn family recombination-promoting nuclease/putative transposase [Spirochaetaceae bacterium]|jgi:predicted transposase/invertase (TIGR01784 family)|nr:Rpn family recombination-promoting nuclease/putative transposase [Spirochaetaceae bacterium]